MVRLAGEKRKRRDAVKGREVEMVNESGLQLIGWVLAATTAMVMLIAAVLVTEATAFNKAGPQDFDGVPIIEMSQR